MVLQPLTQLENYLSQNNNGSGFYVGDSFTIECPVGSGKFMTLKQVSAEISKRLSSIFYPGADGLRPCFGTDTRFRDNPDWQNLVQFHEFFHGDTGYGLGASHQTGWTALVTRLIGKGLFQ